MANTAKQSTGDVRVKVKGIIELLSVDASWDETWKTLQAVADGRLDVRTEPSPDASPVNDMESHRDVGPGMGFQAADPAQEKPGTLADVVMPEEEVEEDDGAKVHYLHKRAFRFKVAAFITLVIGLGIPGLLDSVITEVTSTYKILIKIYVFVLIYFVYRIHRTGRFYAQKAKELPVHDYRQPVIYLRSFVADKEATKVRVSGLTEEEQIVGILKDIGPVIALENPREEILAPGAQRISSSNQTWQQRILELMLKAQLVVIRLGDTKSLGWEFAQARRILDPRRLVLIVPLKKTFDYDDFKSRAESDLGIDLQHTDFSEPIGSILKRILTLGRRFQDYYSFQGFIYFDDSWKGMTAIPDLTWKGYLHSPLTQPGRANIAYVLKPVFERIGAPLPVLKFNWVLLIFMMLFAGGGIIGVLSHVYG